MLCSLDPLVLGAAVVTLMVIKASRDMPNDSSGPLVIHLVVLRRSFSTTPSSTELSPGPSICLYSFLDLGPELRT